MRPERVLVLAREAGKMSHQMGVNKKVRKRIERGEKLLT
jgi:hypothetical protein